MTLLVFFLEHSHHYPMVLKILFVCFIATYLHTHSLSLAILSHFRTGTQFYSSPFRSSKKEKFHNIVSWFYCFCLTTSFVCLFSYTGSLRVSLCKSLFCNVLFSFLCCMYLSNVRLLFHLVLLNFFVCLFVF